MVKNRIDKTCSITVFLAVLLSSMTGVQIFGISLNKIALLPLEIVTIIISVHRNKLKIQIDKCKQTMFLWFLCTLFSCFLAFRVYISVEGFYSNLILYIIQIIFIYIPLLLSLNNIPGIEDKFIKSIEIVATINVFVVYLQFSLWYLFSIDLNSLLFNDILHGFLGYRQVSWNYELGLLLMRPGGLNTDPGFLSLMMIIAFALTKKKTLKFLYLTAVILAVSRSGIVTILILILYSFVKKKNLREINIKKLLETVALIVGLFIILCVIYNKVIFVQEQISKVLARFNFTKLFDRSGTYRHILYLPLAIKVWFNDFGIIGKLFGYGPRASGLILYLSNTARNANIAFNYVMRSTVWSTENSISDLLLGYGIIPFVLFFILIIYLWKTREEKYHVLLIGILIFGSMYTAYTNTFTILVILMLCNFEKRGKSGELI